MMVTRAEWSALLACIWVVEQPIWGATVGAQSALPIPGVFSLNFTHFLTGCEGEREPRPVQALL